MNETILFHLQQAEKLSKDRLETHWDTEANESNMRIREAIFWLRESIRQNKTSVRDVVSPSHIEHL